jgi:hypothetical protein
LVPRGGLPGIRRFEKDGIDSRLKIGPKHISHPDRNRPSIHGLAFDASDRSVGIWCDHDRGLGEEPTQSIGIIEGGHSREQVPAAEM